MNRSKDMASFDFGGPAIYRIVVQGTMSESWRSRFDGVAVTPLGQAIGAPRTSLRGRLRDQAALRGLLETLYALHLPILEVIKEEGRAGENVADGSRQELPGEEAS